MSATEALVFDAIRTPRGKGKVNGSLHATKPVDLVVGLMHEMLARQTSSSTPTASTTSSSAVSPRSAIRAATIAKDRRDQGRPARHGRRGSAEPLLAPPGSRPSTRPR